MDKIIILVAGNPDAYPLEYYDGQSGTYQGLIPQLLKEFSDSTEYEIRYYEPGASDRRKRLARNRQVDIISGCTDADDFDLPGNREVVILKILRGGG